MPTLHRDWVQGWLDAHRDWDHRIWTQADLPELVNQAAFHSARSFAQRADIARYELVYEHGGIYLDTDMECRRPLDSLIGGVGAFVGAESETRLGNAIFGATAGHPWLAAVVEALPASMAEHRHTLDQTGPGLLTRITARRTDVKVFPPAVFYPYGAKRRDAPPVVSDQTYAVHHWEGSWWGAERCVDDDLRERVQRALSLAVPPAATVVVVDADLGVAGVDVTLVPFLERDGVSWGTPRDDTEAITAVRDMPSRGVGYLAFASPAFWWFSYYPGLADALRRDHHVLADTPDVVIYELRSNADGRPPPRRGSDDVIGEA